MLSTLRTFVDPFTWFHLLRILHFYSYAHVRERRKVTVGRNVGIAPNVSFRNGERIRIGDDSIVGERSCLWAGDGDGRIVIGKNLLGAPEVFITASNYGTDATLEMRQQPKRERDVFVGDDVWLGARVIVLPGVTIGDRCVVGAGSVVTRSLPAASIAVGAPAKVVGRRDTKGVG